VALIKIMTCGSVDDGKSTLLGRILYETKNVFLDHETSLNKLNSKYGKSTSSIDYSLLLDGLLDEKKQGITIDLAYKYFKIGSKNFIFIDSPGHKEFTRNVANAASIANVALVLIDAKNGVTSQTRKHLEIISLFSNIKKVIICVNKIDLIKNIDNKIEEIKKEIYSFTKEINLNVDYIIPISALNDINISKNNIEKSIYNGEPLIEIISKLTYPRKSNLKSSAVEVQFLKKHLNKERLAFGKTYFGKLQVNDELINTTTNERTFIKKIYSDFSETSQVDSMENISFNYSPQISIEKGDILVSTNSNKLLSTNSIKSKIIWVSKNSPTKSKRYIFKFNLKIIHGFFSDSSVNKYEVNDIFNTTVELEKKIILSEYSQLYEFSRFLIIDPISNETVGFGYVSYSLDRGQSVISQNVNSKNDNNSFCIWMTGLASSGKTTIAREFGKKLEQKNIRYYILDGDNLRSTLNQDLGFSDSDRLENNRRTAHVAKILSDAGIIPIVSTISPSLDSREFARSLFDKNKFYETYVNTSIETCIKRNNKGLYSEVKKNKNITGLGSNYDIPKNPEITLDAENLSIKQTVNYLYDQIFG